MVLFSNGCLSKPQGVSAWWKKTAQTRVFLLSRPLLLNRPDPQSSKANLLPRTLLHFCGKTFVEKAVCRENHQAVLTYFVIDRRVVRVDCGRRHRPSTVKNNRVIYRTNVEINVQRLRYSYLSLSTGLPSLA